jgi:RND family efflux transporter MFP subunit
MGKKLSYLIAGIVLAFGITFAIILILTQPDTAFQEAPSRVPFVRTTSVMNGVGPIPIYGGGTVRTHSEVNVASEVSGRIDWVNPSFQSGGQVTSGEALFRIDDSSYQVSVDRARANLATQELELIRVTTESEIAQLQFENWKRSESSDDPRPLALWKPQLDVVQAALQREQSELAEAELNLSRTVVRSPFSAAVLRESVAVGEFVIAGQSVGQLYSIDTVEVVVSLTDESAALIPRLWELKEAKINQRIPAKIIAGYGNHDYSWAGYVDRAEVALAQQTRTIQVVICVPLPFTSGRALNTENGTQPNKPPPLLIGKFVDVEIDGETPNQYFKVRRSALKPNNEVWVVADNKIQRVSVQVLQRSEDEVFLTGALSDGDQVVVTGLQTAIDGMIVRTDS